MTSRARELLTAGFRNLPQKPGSYASQQDKKRYVPIHVAQPVTGSDTPGCEAGLQTAEGGLPDAHPEDAP